MRENVRVNLKHRELLQGIITFFWSGSDDFAAYFGQLWLYSVVL